MLFAVFFLVMLADVDFLSFGCKWFAALLFKC